MKQTQGALIYADLHTAQAVKPAIPPPLDHVIYSDVVQQQNVPIIIIFVINT